MTKARVIWRLGFTNRMRAAGFTEAEIRALLRASATLNRLNEASCVGTFPFTSDTPTNQYLTCTTCDIQVHKEDIRKGRCSDCRTSDRVIAIMASHPGWSTKFQGDPRGPSIILRNGQDEIRVPC